MENRVSISFCTVCMNRLRHLKETLPINLSENAKFNNVEFVLLDYTSNDGLEDWVKTNFTDEIINKQLIYYRYNSATSFKRSHSRNIAFRLARNEVVCNLDSDNFVLEDFTEYLFDSFARKQNIFITADTEGKHYFFRDVMGRISCLRSDFLKIKGFDESMTGYGFEDNDLISRLEKLGRKRIVIADRDLLTAITHPDADRVSNEEMSIQLQSLYFSKGKDGSFHFFLFLKDSSFISGEFLFNKIDINPLPYGIRHRQKGNWHLMTRGDLRLTYVDSSNMILQYSASLDQYVFTNGSENFTYDRVHSDNEVIEFLYRFMMITNFEIFERNRTGSDVNPTGFGKGSVVNSFNQTEIHLE